MTQIDSVNYSIHPIFDNGSESWNCSENLLQKFSDDYLELQKGNTCKRDSLLAIADEIRLELTTQATTEKEKRFLAEVFSDVAKQIEEQTTFYTKKKKNLQRIRTLDSKQKSLMDDDFYLTAISEKTLQKISRITSRSLAMLQENAANGKRERQDLSVNSGIVILRVVRALNKDFKKSGVLKSLDVVSSGKFKVIGTSFELSVAGSTWWQPRFGLFVPSRTSYAHVDREVYAPKAIVYLTDVDLSNGPTSCYPGVYRNLNINGLQDFIGRCWENIGRSSDSPLKSFYDFSGPVMDSEGFRSHFMKLPPSLRFNSHFGWDVVPASELEDYLVSTERHIVGPAGTAIVFDGARLLHRGGLITNGQRVVLQVVFGHVTTVRKIRLALLMMKRLMRNNK